MKKVNKVQAHESCHCGHDHVENQIEETKKALAVDSFPRDSRHCEKHEGGKTEVLPGTCECSHQSLGEKNCGYLENGGLAEKGCGCGQHRAEKRNCGHSENHGFAELGCGCGHGHGGGKLSEKQQGVAFLLRVTLSAALLALGAFLPLQGQWNLAFFIPSYLIIGADVMLGAVKGILKGKIFDERLLMLIASLGAFLIAEAPEGVLVMLLYQVGEFLTGISLSRSKKSISALTKLRPEFAVVLRNGQELSVDPETVAVGEMILVKAGERIPLDGRILKGKTSLDMSFMTGESVPVSKSIGEKVLSGAVNLEGLIEVEVTKPFGASSVMRILEMVTDASEKKTKTERFIKKFAKYYTPAVVAAAALIAIVPPLILAGGWFTWINTALLFLVISCPCALVIAVPLTYFAGVGGASRQGILVKGGNSLDVLKKVKTVVFDKTGTLTEGVFQVTAQYPMEGVSEEYLAKIAAAAECRSNHPIAKSVVARFGKTELSMKDYKELSGLGVFAKIEEKLVFAGNEKLMQAQNIPFIPVKTGGSVVYISEDGKFLGAIVVSDKIKVGAREAIYELNRMGAATFMLTGDRDAVAKEVASELGLCGYRAELLPGDKVLALEEILKTSVTAFVGDGVNDAPVITRADVGFAMGAMGQDAAIEAADVVIMDDNLAKVAKSLKVAKKTGRIAAENIVFALGVKAIIMVLGLLSIANMWLAVFADVGVTLLAVANAMRAYLTRKK